MSDLVINEMTPVDQDKLITKKLKVSRFSVQNLGIRMWYVVFDEQGIAYQRYSLMMNPTDEVLVTIKVGDVIEIQYYKDHVQDGVFNRFSSFDRNTIVTAKYV